MPFYGFKENPRQRVITKAKKLFGKDAKVVVTGTRYTPEQCKSAGYKVGSYVVSAVVTDPSGKDFCSVTSNMINWRKAYDVLAEDLEKVFNATKAVQTATEKS